MGGLGFTELGRRVARIVVPLLLLIAGCGGAEAHSFGVIYNLPIPLWMYAFAASATLVLSFVMIGFFVTGQHAERASPAVKIKVAVPRIWWTIFRCLSVFLLVLTILTGLFGTERPLNNFSLTFFWIGFVLGFAYLTALVGDIYEFVNPWRVMCDIIEQFRPMAFKGRVRYPDMACLLPRSLPLHGFHLA